MKLLTPLLISGAVLITVLSSCNSSSRNESTQGGVSTDSEAVLHKAVTFSEMLANPYTDLGLSREQYHGKEIYDHFCAVCHGENGDGNGFNSFNLQNSFQVKPFNFTDSTAMAQLSRSEMERAIKEGGTAVGKSPYMPPWGHTLRSDEIKDVIDYIVTFKNRK